jgi:hypothetical protein
MAENTKVEVVYEEPTTMSDQEPQAAIPTSQRQINVIVLDSAGSSVGESIDEDYEGFERPEITGDQLSRAFKLNSRGRVPVLDRYCHYLITRRG